MKCDSCQYFAGMLIHLRFGENLALCILFGPIFREGHAKFFLVSNISFCSTPQAIMVRTMTEGIVNRFLSSVKAEMLRKNETEIRCPCRRCKLRSLMDLDSVQVQDHLLLRGFMDGYRWQGDEDDYKVVHGGGQEMRKGNKTTTTARAGEKTKNLQDMITTVMLYTVIM